LASILGDPAKLKTMLKKLIFLSIMILIISCDCQIRVKGLVLNKETNSPIPNIAIGKTDTTDLDNPFNEKIFTDNEGQFEFMGIAGQCNDISLYFSGKGFKTKKVTMINGSSDTVYLTPDKNNILLENSAEINFSSNSTKDRFVITLTGQSIIDGKVLFKIYSSDGNELWNEKFKATDLIGYGLDFDSSTDEKEKFIKKRISDFFKQDNFINPAIGTDEKYDSDYSDKDIWTDIISDSTATGFYYLIGEERGCQIAYSKKQKKIVTYFCCC